MGRVFDLDYWDTFLDYNGIRILMVGFSAKDPPTVENTVVLVLKDDFIILNKADYDRIVARIGLGVLPFKQMIG